MDPYFTAKWLHILSSTVLFGTGIGTAFAMVWAMRAEAARTLAHTAGGVVVADWLFTLPSGLVQPATGLWLIHLTGHDPWSSWLVITYAAYVFALCLWLPVVWLQYRIRDLARAAGEGPIPSRARALFRIWVALGCPAFVALVGVFWLMVSKPALW